mmetsp:Transcript_27950/g.65186  ORF Transcript_27950/g.65186 Transcript_27950/m.65186 type:complete len:132 (+) Transcript_27950:514-909(+)
MEGELQRSLTEAVHCVWVRGVPQQQQGQVAVATPGCIVQGGVGLGVPPPRAWASAGFEQKLYYLESVGVPEETGAGCSELQRELAASLEAQAPRVGLCSALQQQAHCWRMCLADGFVQSMFPWAWVAVLQG